MEFPFSMLTVCVSGFFPLLDRCRPREKVNWLLFRCGTPLNLHLGGVGACSKRPYVACTGLYLGLTPEKT